MGRKSTSRRVCKWKVKHKTEIEATQHAVELCADKGQPQGHWKAYDCPWCEFWHVGRDPRPTAYREPIDITLLNELGSRVYYCGVQENHPRPSIRLKTIRRRAEKADWVSWNARQSREFHERQADYLAKRGVKKVRGAK